MEEKYSGKKPEVRSAGETGLFALRVKGNCMQGARICDGDYIIVRRQAEAEEGDIVAASYSGETIIRQLFRQGGKVLLAAAHCDYSPLLCSPEELRILGKVTAVQIDLESNGNARKQESLLGFTRE